MRTDRRRNTDDKQSIAGRRERPTSNGMRELEKTVVGQLNRYPQVRVAYLFGSQARGQAGPLSDVDVAVLLDENLTPAEAQDLQLRLMTDLADALGRDDVDVIVLNYASLVLCHQVLKSGRILLCRDETARFRFTFKTNRDYLDAVPMYELHRAYQRRRIKEGKFGDRRGDYTAALAAARRETVATQVAPFGPGAGLPPAWQARTHRRAVGQRPARGGFNRYFLLS